MKIRTLISLTAILGTGVHAATITVDTLAFVQSAGGVNIVDNTGVVAIGTYGPSDPAIGASFTKSQITTGFTQLGQNTLDSTSDLAGYFKFNLTVNIENSFNTLPVFLVIGNGNDLASSTEFLVWKATSNPDGNTFVEDNPFGGPGTIQLNNATGSLFAGEFDSTVFKLEAAVLVPEPSSTALLGLGGIALLLRRRR